MAYTANAKLQGESKQKSGPSRTTTQHYQQEYWCQMIRLTGVLALALTVYFFLDDRHDLFDISWLEAGFCVVFFVQTVKIIGAGRQCGLSVNASLSKMFFAIGLLAWALFALGAFFYFYGALPSGSAGGDRDNIPNQEQLSWLLLVLTAQSIAKPKPAARSPAENLLDGVGQTKSSQEK